MNAERHQAPQHSSSSSSIGQFVGDKLILPAMPYVATTLIADASITAMSRGAVSFPITRTAVQGVAVLGTELVVAGARTAQAGFPFVADLVRTNPRVSMALAVAAAAGGYLYYKFSK